MTENERIVTDFCNAWSRMDADELADYFTPDGIYHNIPMEPRQGREVIRENLKDLPKRVKEFRIEILLLTFVYQSNGSSLQCLGHESPCFRSTAR